MLLRKTLSGGISIVGDRVARFTISDDSIDRAGEVVEQAGADLSLFLQNPVVLAGHDPAFPIGTAGNIRRDGTRTIADLTLAPPGVSPKADEYWGLIQAGILKSTSIGFDVVLSEPMDPARPRGPQRYKKWILCEISIVAIPAQSRATLIDATNAKSLSESAKAERRRKAAEMEKTGRQQAARAAALGNIVLAPAWPNEVTGLTKAQRVARAHALIESGSGPRPAGPTTIREAEVKRAGEHAYGALAAHRDQHPSRDDRRVRAGLVNAKDRPAGY